MNYNSLKHFEVCFILFLVLFWFIAENKLYTDVETGSSKFMKLQQPVNCLLNPLWEGETWRIKFLCRRKVNCYSFTISDCKYTNIYMYIYLHMLSFATVFILSSIEYIIKGWSRLFLCKKQTIKINTKNKHDGKKNPWTWKEINQTK